MKLTKPVILLISLVIILSGVIFVLLGVNLAPGTLKAIFEAVGTGLIAAGGVNALDRLLTQEMIPEGIRIIADARKDTKPSVRNRKYNAGKVDILGVSLTGCLEEFVGDPQHGMINRVLFNHSRLRLILVNPKAAFVTQRAFEDGLSVAALIKRQKKSVELSVQFYLRLRERYMAAAKNETFDPKTIGSVEIKLIDFCPYITVERVDDEIYWGLYTSATAGMNLPLLSVTKDQNYALYDQLKQHFSSLRERDRSAGDHFLVRMVLGPPILNEELAKEILGAKRLKTIVNGH